MHRRSLKLVLGMLVAATGLIIAGAAGGVSQKASAGSVVFGAEQEPPCLNGFLAGCNNTSTSWTAGTALASPYLVYPDFSLRPYMGSAKVLKKRPFTLRVTLNKGMKWSDGKAITAADVVFTWHEIMNPNYDLAGRAGWELIKSAKVNNARTVTFTFTKPYAPWKVMLNTSILPAHALAGENFNEVWNTNYKNKAGQEMSSGPFMLQSYTKGQSLTMVRNPRFWGHKPSLTKITFVFRTNTDTEIQAIRGGEVDAIYPQPQLALADLKGQAGLRIQTHLGLQEEHIEIQQGAKGNPLAKQTWLRQALITALNRTAAAKALYGTLNSKIGALNSLVRLTNEPGYTPHFKKWNYNVNKVAALMKAHNCTKGSDGIYSCNGTKVSFLFESTVGNKLRELAFTIFQDQAAKAGIQLKNGFVPAGTLFGSHLPEHNFDLAMFTYVLGVDPHYNVSIFSCGSPGNYGEYCNRNVTQLLSASDTQLSDAKRVALINKADTIMANDVPQIPLFQRATYFVYKSNVKGMVDNASSQGPSWNAESWSKG